MRDELRTRVDVDCREGIEWKIGLLNECNNEMPHLGAPHSSALKGKHYRAFRELRCHCGRQQHRIIYRRSDGFFILLHIIFGKEDEIEEQDKKIALDRWEDFKARMDAVPRPRAIGHDAP